MDRRHFIIAAAGLFTLTPLVKAAETLFLNYTQDSLNSSFNLPLWATNSHSVMRSYREDSAAVRKKYPPKTVKYGRTPIQSLDIFSPPRAKNLPVFVFIHGGQWQSKITKNDASAPAQTFVQNGCVYVAIDFNGMPKVKIDEMVAECRLAISWIYHHIAQYGGDPKRIFLGGHGSGAHLAAVLMTTNWRSKKLPTQVIRGGVVISGVYELYPVFLSAENKTFKFTANDVVTWSPVRHLDELNCSVIVASGDKDSPEYQRQANALTFVLGGMGKLQKAVISSSMNHYEVVTDLNKATTDLSAAILQMIRTTV